MLGLDAQSRAHCHNNDGAQRSRNPIGGVRLLRTTKRYQGRRAKWDLSAYQIRGNSNRRDMSRAGGLLALSFYLAEQVQGQLSAHACELLDSEQHTHNECVCKGIQTAENSKASSMYAILSPVSIDP